MLEILLTSCSGLDVQAKGEGALGQQFGWIMRPRTESHSLSLIYVNFPYNSKDNKNTMQAYLVTVMTHVIALVARQLARGP